MSFAIALFIVNVAVIGGSLYVLMNTLFDNEWGADRAWIAGCIALAIILAMGYVDVSLWTTKIQMAVGG